MPASSTSAWGRSPRSIPRAPRPRHGECVFEAIPTSIPEVVIVRPSVFEDARGFFLETYQERQFAQLGITERFVQDNHSRSRLGTIRGLHYQLRTQQAKLCRVVSGSVLDVAVDIRVGSPTFGEHVSAVLSAENRLQIFVPRGFAHGFAVLTESAEFLYKCSDFYAPDDEHGIRFDDPDLAIDWGVATPIVSAKDRTHRPLREVPHSLLPSYAPPGRTSTTSS